MVKNGLRPRYLLFWLPDFGGRARSDDDGGVPKGRVEALSSRLVIGGLGAEANIGDHFSLESGRLLTKDRVVHFHICDFGFRGREHW